jgi:hypothetical protein
MADNIIQKLVKRKKEKEEVKKKAIIEAEKIFMKNRPDMEMKDNSYPKVDEFNRDTPYGKEATRTQNQVVKTRLEMWRKKKKNK